MEENCVICFDVCIENVNECTECDINVCESCIVQWYNEKKEKICPICKKNINNDDYFVMHNNTSYDVNMIYNYRWTISICTFLLIIIYLDLAT